MDINDIDRGLGVTGGALSLSSETLAGLDIQPLLTAHNGGQPVRIEGATKTSDGVRVVVSGTASFMRVASLPVSAFFTADGDGRPQVCVRFTLIDDVPGPAPWKFSVSFPDLPATRDFSLHPGAPQTSVLDELALSASAFVLSTAEGSDPVTGVAVERGLNFVGKLRPTGVLGMFEVVVGGSRELTLYGTVDVPPPNEIALPEARPDTYPWEYDPPPPGIRLRADLGVEITAGGLKFGETVLRVYTPLTREWWIRNPTYEPAMGVTGLLDIDGAGISVEVTALLLRGWAQVVLAGRFEGVSVGNLSRLSGVANGDDLFENLPEPLKGPVAALADLSLEAVAVSFGGTFAPSAVEYTYVRVGLPETVWTLIDGALELKDISVQFTVTSPFDASRGLFAVVRGEVVICGVTFDAWLGMPDISVRAQLDDDDVSLPLTQLFTTYLPELPAPPNLAVNQLDVSVVPGRSYSFFAAVAEDPPWTIDLGPVPMTISNVELSARKEAGASATGSFAGTVEFGDDLILQMRYEMPGAFLIRAEFPEVKLSQLIARLSQQTPVLPDGFDLTFNNSAVVIENSTGAFKFLLGTQLEGVGSFAFEARKVGGTQWGFAAGLSISGSASSLPSLSALSLFEEFFGLRQLTLVLSTFDDIGFTFPDMASFQSPRLPPGTPTLPATGGVIAGFNFHGVWVINTADRQQNLLFKFLGLNPTLGITLQVGKNPSQDARLYVSYDTKIDGRYPFSCKFGGQIKNGSVGLFLEGSFAVEIQGQRQTFTLVLVFVENGAFLSATMRGTTPVVFSFEGVEVFKLGNVAVVIGINWEGIPSLGLAATLVVAGKEFACAVFLNSSNPSQSMVAGAMSDLTLGEVVSAITADFIPDEFKDLLDLVSIEGTRKFELPGAVADALDNLKVAEVSAAFAAAGVQIPAATDQVFLTVDSPGSRWYLTDLRNRARHYQLRKAGDKVEVSVEAQVYCAPQRTTIGALPPFEQGFFINGRVNFFGLYGEATIDIDPTRGVAIDGAMSRIVIGSEIIFSIKAKEGDGGPRLSLATFSQPTLEEEQFRAPHFYVNGEMSMLGLSRGLYAKIDKTGVSFDLNGPLMPAVNFDLSCKFGELGQNGGSLGLAVGGSLNVGVGTVDLGPLGSVRIDTGADGALDLSVGGDGVAATFDAEFAFAGQKLDVPRFDLDVSGETFKSLPATIYEKVKAALLEFFKDAAKWAEYVAKEFIKGVEDVKQVLIDVYKKTAEEAEKIWEAAQGLVEEAKKTCAMTTAALGL